MTDNTPNTTHTVVVNAEGQYSLWPSYKPVPDGWTAVGREGTREECLTYIATVWTSITPRSAERQ